MGTESASEFAFEGTKGVVAGGTGTRLPLLASERGEVPEGVRWVVDETRGLWAPGTLLSGAS